jgi:hypothetical protein
MERRLIRNGNRVILLIVSGVLVILIEEMTACILIQINGVPPIIYIAIRTPTISYGPKSGSNIHLGHNFGAISSRRYIRILHQAFLTLLI